uniref:claudin-15-like isoform X1 n=1 Tax=Ciona intestinalis TaxID=7719 RepID=UPI000EF4BB69|nr:claudin-15-like isoform X1 [Ciona intestinalis]|eukprot:XP_004225520.2 claudin-15-like isoform X1 [Ciona intestinalis]
MPNYNNQNYPNDPYDNDRAAGVPSNGIRTASTCLAFLSLVMFAFVLGAPYWRTTANWGSVSAITNIWEFEGLFLTCVKSGGGQGTSQCYQMTAFMGAGTTSNGFNSGYVGTIYTYLNAFRALMIIGFIASLGGVVCSVLGMRCASVVDEESKAKRWIVIIGGLCHIAAGVLTGICVSWYAAEVVWEYYSPYYQTQKLKYTLGACLYVGWIAMLFALVAGCLMTCCACCNKPADSTNTYSYNPAKLQAPNHSYPEPTVYRSEPVVEKAVYDHRPDYYRSSSKSKRSKYSNRRDEHSSSGSSSRSNSPSRHSRSHKSRSSRHASDSIRASGFV